MPRRASALAAAATNSKQCFDDDKISDMRLSLDQVDDAEEKVKLGKWALLIRMKKAFHGRYIH